MKKAAAIDIGTNSMRLMLCEIVGNSIAKKEKELIVTRIGTDVSKTGLITEKAFVRNIDALKYFRNKAVRYGAEEVLTIATSAVRDAANGKEFAAEALAQAGVEVMIVSGEEEAELGLIGVMSEIEDPQENILVIDIGGGSTELVLGNRGRIEYLVSIPAGVVRMTEQFIKDNPIGDEDIENMKARLTELFREPLEHLGEKKIGRVIAIGGTATTTAAIFHNMSIYDPTIVHNTIIGMDFIRDTFKRLKDMSVLERYDVAGLQKERADVIPAGIYIMKHLLDGLKIGRFTVSENDNLEGIIEKYILSKTGR